jgi:hypothetical protein
MVSPELPSPPRKAFERLLVVALGVVLAVGLWQAYGEWLFGAGAPGGGA